MILRLASAVKRPSYQCNAIDSVVENEDFGDVRLVIEVLCANFSSTVVTFDNCLTGIPMAGSYLM